MASAASRFYYSSPQMASIGQNIGSIFAGPDPAEAARARLIESQIVGNAADAWQTNSETEILRRRDAALTAAGDALRSGSPDVRAAARDYLGRLVSSSESTANAGDVLRAWGFMNPGVDAGSGIGDTFVMAGGGGYGDTAAGFRSDQERLAAAAAAEDATKRRGQDVASADTRYATDVGTLFEREELGVNDATTRRGQDLESTDRRYSTDRTTDASVYDTMLDAETARRSDDLLDARERTKLADERAKPIPVPMNNRLVTPLGELLLGPDPSATGVTIPDGAMRVDASGKTIASNPKDGEMVDSDGDGVPDTFVSTKAGKGGPGSPLKPIDANALNELALSALGAAGDTAGPESMALAGQVAARAGELLRLNPGVMTEPEAIKQAVEELAEFQPYENGWFSLEKPAGFVPRTGAAPAAPAAPAAAAPAAPPAATEPTAVNPQTGEVLVFRNGAWVKP